MSYQSSKAIVWLLVLHIELSQDKGLNGRENWRVEKKDIGSQSN